MSVHRTALWITRALATVVVLIVLRSQCALYADVGPPDAEAQLRFVREALDRGEAARMQRLFPEGFLFTHALHGLAWIDRGLAAPPGDPLRARAAAEAERALAQVMSPEGTAPFSESLAPRWGVFHAGWSNWLRGGALLVAPARDPARMADFTRHSEALARAFDASATPFLPAYPGSAWPVDSGVAIASLRLHDAIVAPRFAATVDRWLAMARRHLDPATGLLPHRVEPDGRPIEGARGTSQVVLARFLPEIDAAFAREQYARFRQALVTTRLGLPGVREFPAGVAGSGDVDSGPLVLGISLSATVVAAGAARVQGDLELARGLAGTMEHFGLPLSFGGTRRYALGVLPVGDAFIVWSQGARPWLAAARPAEHPRLLSALWRVPMHLVAGGLVLLVVWLLRPRRATLALPLTLLVACGTTPPAPTPSAAGAMTVPQIAALIAPRVKDPEGWAQAVHDALRGIQLAPDRSHVCAVLAVLAQESGFQEDPVVPGLARMIEKRLEGYREKLGPLGRPLFQRLLAGRSPGDPRSFDERLKKVRTERDLDLVFRDLLAYHQSSHPVMYDAARLAGKLLDGRSLADLNPITTAGSMQVSVRFAEEWARAHHGRPEAARDALYTRAGGVYYGTARLFGHPASYPAMVYRFADYNAGVYASRNAALQAQLAGLTGKTLALDGDFLAYDQDGGVDHDDTQTMAAVMLFRERFAPQLSERRVRKDARQEKTQEFEKTDTYQAIRSVFASRMGTLAEYATLPQVMLESPKISRKLSTAWFAESVDRRYQACLRAADRR